MKRIKWPLDSVEIAATTTEQSLSLPSSPPPAAATLLKLRRQVLSQGNDIYERPSTTTNSVLYGRYYLFPHNHHHHSPLGFPYSNSFPLTEDVPPSSTAYFSTSPAHLPRLLPIYWLFLLLKALLCDILFPPYSAISSSSSASSSPPHQASAKKIPCDLKVKRKRKRHLWTELLKWLLVLAIFLKAFPTAQAGAHERRLLRDLMHNYQILERPVANESDSLTVRFGITLQQVIDVDEKNQQIITNMWLKMEWEDCNLVWNPEDYGGITNLRISPDRVWRPDILMYNSADEKFDGTYHTNVVVQHNGTLTYLPPGIFKSTCKIDITWFPFDDQYCDLKFGSWTYQLDALDLELNSPVGDISSYIPNGEWVLLNLPGVRHEEQYACCPSKYIDITFRLGLRRRTLYYGFNLIVPSMIISSMTLLSFTLPPDSGEKLTLGVTILLSMIVFLMQLAEIMPATSDSVSIVGSYFACIMVMVAFSVVMTVVVLNFHHRTTEQQQEMPRWIRNVICTWLPMVLFIKRPPELFQRYNEQKQHEADCAAMAASKKAPWDARLRPPGPGLNPPQPIGSRPNHHPGVSLVPLYDINGAPHPTEPSQAELMLLSDKIAEYEALVEVENLRAQHRQGCPSVASNVSLGRSTNTGGVGGGGLVPNHVPFGTGVGAAAAGGCNGQNGNDLRHRGAVGGVAARCPYAFTSYPPPPPHSHHFADAPEVDSGLGGSTAANHGYLFSVLGPSDEATSTTYGRPPRPLADPATALTLLNVCCCCCCTGSGNTSGSDPSAAFYTDVMTELRFITNRLRREDDLADIIGEWKFAAIVIDRLCLILFSTFAVLSTAVCLLSAPHLIA